jgi:hypothetical protein
LVNQNGLSLYQGFYDFCSEEFGYNRSIEASLLGHDQRHTGNILRFANFKDALESEPDLVRRPLNYIPCDGRHVLFFLPSGLRTQQYAKTGSAD